MVKDRITRDGGIKDISEDMLPNKSIIINELLKCIYDQYVKNERDLVHIQELYSDLAQRLEVSNKAKSSESKETGDNVCEKRIRFSLLKLKTESFILKPKRAFYAITDLGEFAVAFNIPFKDFAFAEQAARVRTMMEKCPNT